MDSKPWFAVRGVSPRTIDAVVRAGAMRVAVGAAITNADDPGAVARVLKDHLRAAWNGDERMEAVTMSAFGTRPKLSFKPFDAGDGDIEL